MNKDSIYIERQSTFTDLFRSYRIILDGNSIGKIKYRETKVFEIPPGKHSLQLKIDWLSSNILEFEIEDKLIGFECGSNFDYSDMVQSMIDVFFHRNNIIWIAKINHNI